MNSFIQWIGGKKLLRNEIIKRFPPEGVKRYIEVFGGAGWVLFGKETCEEMEVFNDIDSNLVNLYRCLKYHCSELQRELELYLISREQFFDSKELAKQRGLTDIQRAARYYHLIKISFGANRSGFGLKPNNLVDSIAGFSQFSERLKRVVIENKDFENLIKVYDRPESLFYLDPPYVGTEKYYDPAFTMQDHIRLRNALGAINGKFILSYNNDDIVKEMYDGYNIQEVSRSNNMSNNKENRYKELIITNF